MTPKRTFFPSSYVAVVDSVGSSQIFFPTQNSVSQKWLQKYLDQKFKFDSIKYAQ